MTDTANIVYPSLPLWAARERYDKLRVDQREPGSLRLDISLGDPAATWYPTGTRVTDRDLQALRSLIREIANRVGFPRRSQNVLRSFDQVAAGAVHRQMRISPARAGDAGVWAFLSLILVPDIAVWRYPGKHHERLMGGQRNVLQRLWLRAEVLGTGPEDPAALLAEDQLVAIMERPDSLGRDSRVATALAAAVIQRTGDFSGGGMVLMREAAKRASRLSAWMLLGYLDDRTLKSVMDDLVQAIVDANS